MALIAHLPAYLDQAPPDAGAVFAGSDIFGLAGDGETDDAPALQSAVDAAALDEHSGGIVFLPEGEYRLGSTLNLWRGVRIIGVGRRRPRLRLRAGEPGFRGPRRSYLIHFRHRREDPDEDANNCTFFSGLFGLSFVVEKGYPHVAVLRYRVAQHGILRQCDFQLANDCHAAVDQAGHMIEECRFSGGVYGVSSLRTSASWPLCVRACRFEGQGKAALATSRAGLTLMESEIVATPVACAAAPEAAEDLERLYVSDCNFRDVAVLVRRFSVHAAEQQLTLRKCTTARCGHFARFVADTHDEILPDHALIEEWQCGLAVDRPPPQKATEAPGRMVCEGRIRPLDERGVSRERLDLREAMPSVGTWTSVRDFGAMADGRHDDTAALKAALARSDTVYLPMGRYRVSEPILLGPGKRLFGLHPGRTMLELSDREPSFAEEKQPRGLVEVGDGGERSQQLRGLGFHCRDNPSAIGIDWIGGPDSLLEDIYFYARFRDRDPERERCRESIRVRGAGCLRNIWSADIAAACGLRIVETEGPLSCVLLSIEHHREREVIIEHSANVEFVALQTEENHLSPATVAIELRNTRSIRFLNTYLYRVMSLRATPAQAVLVRDCAALRFDNLHAFSWGGFPFTNALYDADPPLWIRQRELVRLDMEAVQSRSPK